MKYLDLSVIMSIHEREDPSYFNLAMKSICESRNGNAAEIIIVQDGRLSDELYQSLAAWDRLLGDALKMIVFSQNKGLGAALNAGLDICSKKYVARMDSDDISFPNRFIKQLEFLELNNNVDVVGSFALEIDSDGSEGLVRSMPVAHEDIYANLWACPLIHPSVMFRRDRIIEVGNYKPNLRRRQDYELWFRCAKHGLRFANIPEPLLYYRFDRNTHKKQSSRLAWEQGKIGFSGSSALGLAWWKRLACFLPFIRSFLPTGLQHNLYRLLKAFDPRRV